MPSGSEESHPDAVHTRAVTRSTVRPVQGAALHQVHDPVWLRCADGWRWGLVLANRALGRLLRTHGNGDLNLLTTTMSYAPD